MIAIQKTFPRERFFLEAAAVGAVDAAVGVRMLCHHHTENDTFDKIDANEMAQNAAAYPVLAWLAAQSPVGDNISRGKRIFPASLTKFTPSIREIAAGRGNDCFITGVFADHFQVGFQGACIQRCATLVSHYAH